MSTSRAIDPRTLAILVLREVLERRRYLDAVLAERLEQHPAIGTRDNSALVREMTYGTMRWYYQLDAVAAQLLDKPLKAKDSDLHLLLLLGLYQMRHTRIASHAAADETVEAAIALGKPWARGLINACLRKYLRDHERGGGRAEGIIARDPVARFSHPQWLIETVKHDHPSSWERILQANNERAPMVLRVNLLRQTRDDYLARLQVARIAASALDIGDAAVLLETPVTVTALPGFADGEVSVQDAAAQLAVALLDVQPGNRVLDACAAPGGKSGHILERSPTSELFAFDIDAERLALVESNQQRLRLQATLRVADAAAPDSWWDRQPFDRILADVPCSATGVIRRHPDIKLRRRPEDIDQLVAAQARILDGLWPTLKRGGKLLYVTCSVLAAENEQQVAAFLKRHTDARELPLTFEAAERRRHGIQVLPGAQTMDGFFYACLEKR